MLGNLESLEFSRSDRQVGGMNVSHIDRMYVSEPIGDSDGSVGILLGNCFSDHFLVMLVVDEGERREGSRRSVGSASGAGRRPVHHTADESAVGRFQARASRGERRVGVGVRE